MPQPITSLYLATASHLVTARSSADGVASVLSFAVLERGSDLQHGYVSLHMPALGAPEGVLCGFEVLRHSDGRPGPWIAQGDVRAGEGSGALVLAGLAVTAVRDEVDDDDPVWGEGAAPSPVGGVTAAVLRSIPLGWVHLALAEVRSVRRDERVLWLLEALSPPGEAWFGHPVADGAEVLRKRPGRPPLPDEYLRHVAELVLQEPGAGTHRRVGAKLQKEPSTIRDHIAAARREGWLAPTSAGRRDAAPGPRLLAYWEDKA